MMDNMINGRTPQTIKKRVGCWNAFRQKKCPAAKDIAFKKPGVCENCTLRVPMYAIEQATVDILEYAEQLERERDAAVAEIESLNAEIDAINEDFLRGIHTVREDAQPKWISVEERLPEDDLPEDSDVKVIKVFVAIKVKNGITIRTQLRHRRVLYDTRGEPFFDWEWRHSAGNVAHWMPLPEPPKEEK